MKYLHFLFVFLLVGAIACNDSEPADTGLTAAREDFAAASTYGVYKNGSRALVFNQNEHQFRFNPAQRLYGIVHDAGEQYALLTLEGTPTGSAPVKASFRSTFSVEGAQMEDLVLLRSDEEKLWLWSDSRRMGFLFPRFTE